MAKGVNFNAFTLRRKGFKVMVVLISFIWSLHIVQYNSLYAPHTHSWKYLSIASLFLKKESF